MSGSICNFTAGKRTRGVDACTGIDHDRAPGIEYHEGVNRQQQPSRLAEEGRHPVGMLGQVFVGDPRHECLAYHAMDALLDSHDEDVADLPGELSHCDTATVNGTRPNRVVRSCGSRPGFHSSLFALGDVLALGNLELPPRLVLRPIDPSGSFFGWSTYVLPDRPACQRACSARSRVRRSAIDRRWSRGGPCRFGSCPESST